MLSLFFSAKFPKVRLSFLIKIFFFISILNMTDLVKAFSSLLRHLTVCRFHLDELEFELFVWLLSWWYYRECIKWSISSHMERVFSLIVGYFNLLNDNIFIWFKIQKEIKVYSEKSLAHSSPLLAQSPSCRQRLSLLIYPPKDILCDTSSYRCISLSL